MKRFFAFSYLLILVAIYPLRGGEGMWLPLLLGQLNEAEMQALGMKMSAEDIYSVNQGSLKDAIVHFGGFCTGEVISNNGLILTNHHCGFGQIQSHSSLENNYIEDGFWAASKEGELTNPGLYATFIVRIEDVTEQILAGIDDKTHPKEKQAMIDRALLIVKDLATKEDYQDVMIKPFFHGNQYFLFVTETYRDIRLVGAPPSSIGKFGADTDNWEWPRHTGDFSLFRIYAGPDNKPAEYAEENVPFEPRHHLPISLDGVEENDFTLVFGFPYRTDEYLPAVAVDQRVNLLNPIRIGIRDKTLAILDEAMRSDEETRIQYASKQSRIANSWKKWIGESQGIERTDGIGRKKELEAEFQAQLADNSAWKQQFGSILPSFNRLYSQIEPFAKSRDYVNEITYRNIELFRLVNILKGYLKVYENSGMEGMKSRLDRLTNYLSDFYKNYRPEIDQKVAASLLDVYFSELTAKHLAPYAVDQAIYAGKDYEELAGAIFTKSFLTKGEIAMDLLKENPEGFFKQLQGDYAYQFVDGIQSHSQTAILKRYNEIKEQIDRLQSRYMQALMTVFPDRRFYPDANSTMRVSYGQVEGYEISAEEQYGILTYLDGVIEKYVPGDYEFDVPEKLLELHKEGDYGQYAAENGKVPVCFLGSNHTSGGNSGSPAIDAYGNLIGLNFDRTWHGTMSDINYDRSICRNIMVDIRYVLFIVDKFAGASYLVDEMTLVHPKG